MWWTASALGIAMCQSVAVESHMRESPSMEKITTIVQVFQVHGVNGANAVVVRAEGRDRLSVPRSAITQARVSRNAPAGNRDGQ
ncbi:hypothetical protein CIT25_33210 [Mesorhizobium mediterraneum]|uniref:Uncharacterized protein n=2 Tax=Phyllobacteriaceae TaxID=69277 RepID=A0AB36R0Q4_9HYPH|nr:hypothetical protein CIT25_33210 [Mesorhizobium mediterraneum]